METRDILEQPPGLDSASAQPPPGSKWSPICIASARWVFYVRFWHHWQTQHTIAC